MHINIKATNIEVNDHLRDYIEEKIGELEKFIPGKNLEVNTRVNIGKPSRHHENGEVYEVAVDIAAPGMSFRATSSGMDLYSIVTDVKDELQEEIKKYKEKNITKTRKSFRLFKNLKNRGE